MEAKGWEPGAGEWSLAQTPNNLEPHVINYKMTH